MQIEIISFRSFKMDCQVSRYLEIIIKIKIYREVKEC